MIKIMLIETDKCCYINDCYAKDGYKKTYHSSAISNLLFDGKFPEKTFSENWLRIDKYPSEVSRVLSGKVLNARFEIKDPSIVSEKLPMVITYDDRDKFSEDVLNALYTYRSEVGEEYTEPVEVEIEKVLEVENFVEPTDFSFKAIRKHNYGDHEYTITRADINHPMIDKIIMPEFMLANRPCSFSSKQVYDITRQYIRDNFDPKVAKITSDYDFCFEVKKLIPYFEPENVSYTTPFARTKKERSKIRFVVKSHKEIKCFEMTNDQENYKGYTPVKSLYGNSEQELKENLDNWLATVIGVVNEPIHFCEHCKGTGYEPKE